MSYNPPPPPLDVSPIGYGERDTQLSGTELPEVGRHHVRQHQLQVLQDVELQEGARVELHALRAHTHIQYIRME